MPRVGGLGVRACDVDLEASEIQIATLKRRKEHRRSVHVPEDQVHALKLVHRDAASRQVPEAETGSFGLSPARPLGARAGTSCNERKSRASGLAPEAYDTTTALPPSSGTPRSRRLRLERRPRRLFTSAGRWHCESVW